MKSVLSYLLFKKKKKNFSHSGEAKVNACKYFSEERNEKINTYKQMYTTFKNHVRCICLLKDIQRKNIE